jgi:hypothetical protein
VDVSLEWGKNDHHDVAEILTISGLHRQPSTTLLGRELHGVSQLSSRSKSSNSYDRFDILGTTLASSIGLVSDESESNGILSLLQDTEGNHCSSLPTDLLRLLQRGAQLSHTVSAETTLHSARTEIASLLHAAETFDPTTWSLSLGPQFPTADHTDRTNVATAHKAAVRIYLLRTQQTLDPDSSYPETLEILVKQIISHLSAIRPGSALFTSTTWPAFVAGAETDDSIQQEWVEQRLRQLWIVEPWGLIRGALGVLQRMWGERRGQTDAEAFSKRNWITDLKAKGVNWLIL